MRQHNRMSLYELKVGMTCGGCSGAVTRLIGKMDGVEVHPMRTENKDRTYVLPK